MTIDRNATATALVEQFRENTGRALLDSGDAYGRGYERWNRAAPDTESAVAAVLAAPSARVNYHSIVANTVQRLLQVLDYQPEADAKFHEWASQRDGYWLENAEEFVAFVNGFDPDNVPEKVNIYGSDYGTGTFNSYNYDNLLDETIQWSEFVVEDESEVAEEFGLIPGERYVLLSTHNGCDVRGGYSVPRVYLVIEDDAILTDVSIYAWHDITPPQEEELPLGVPPVQREHSFYFNSGQEWTDSDGDWLTTDDGAPQFSEDGERLLCPECGETLEVSAG